MFICGHQVLQLFFYWNSFDTGGNTRIASVLRSLQCFFCHSRKETCPPQPRGGIVFFVYTHNTETHRFSKLKPHISTFLTKNTSETVSIGQNVWETQTTHSLYQLYPLRWGHRSKCWAKRSWKPLREYKGTTPFRLWREWDEAQKVTDVSEPDVMGLAREQGEGCDEKGESVRRVNDNKTIGYEVPKSLGTSAWLEPSYGSRKGGCWMSQRSSVQRLGNECLWWMPYVNWLWKFLDILEVLANISGRSLVVCSVVSALSSFSQKNQRCTFLKPSQKKF